MSCEKFENRLHEKFDRREDWVTDPVLARHAASCPACREMLRVYREMFDVLEQDTLPELPDDFASRVVSRVWAERPAPAASVPVPANDRRVTEWAVILAVVATLLVAVVPLALWWSWSAVPTPLPVHVVDSTPAAAEPAVPPTSPSGTNALAVAPEPVGPEQTESAEPPLSPLEKLIPLGPLTAPLPAVVLWSQGMEEGESADPTLPDSDTELLKNSTAWSRQVSIGFRPVADTVNATLRVLRSALGERNAPKGSVPSPQAEQGGFNAWVPIA